MNLSKKCNAKSNSFLVIDATLATKLQQEFINESIVDDKDINNENFLGYFKYNNPSLLVRDLISIKQNKNVRN